MDDPPKLTAFDKFCGAFSIVIGLIFMLMGFIGIFGGSQASFTLPPVLGFLPFFLGWGMSMPLIKFWKISNAANNKTDAPI